MKTKNLFLLANCSKKTAVLILFLSITSSSRSQIYQNVGLAWMNGTTTPGAPPVFGTMGVPAPANTPGARSSCYSWTDNNHNFWLYGGSMSTSAKSSNIWKYETGNGNWTWMNGPNGNGNSSPVYGTKGVASPLNHPGSRHGGASWTDKSGNFWLYGGSANDPNSVDFLRADLWRFDVGNNQWTWIGGPTGALTPVFGTLGIASVSNSPGCRLGSTYWADSAGNFWLFGGEIISGLPTSTATPYAFSYEYMDDLWKYNPNTSEWTWVKGNSTGNSIGVYGTATIPQLTNNPGARSGASGWIDNSGNLWLFGGDVVVAYTATPTPTLTLNRTNDLWRYNIANNTWTWMRGSSALPSSPTNTSSIGTFSNTNDPRGRARAASWTDGNGNLVLFGGMSSFLNLWNINDINVRNDMWVYNPTINEWAWVRGPISGTTSAPANYGVFGVAAASNIPNPFFAGAVWQDACKNAWIYGGAGSTGSGFNHLWKVVTNTVQTIGILSTATTICQGASATLSASGATSFSWSTGQSVNPIVISPTASAVFSVISKDPGGCSNSATIAIAVNNCTGIKDVSGNSEALVQISPNPNSGNFTLSFHETIDPKCTLAIYNSLGAIVHKQTVDNDKQVISLNLPNGAYYCQILQPGKNIQVCKLVIGN